MKTCRLSASLQKALNEQMTLEAYSAQVYLMLSSWADSQSYIGISGFLFKHANEERTHMAKLIEYIQERGGKVTIDAIKKPGVEPKSVQECFEMVFKQEVENTTAIYKIIDLAMKEGDWATWNHLQWFVKEQREEEKYALHLLDKIKIAGGKNAVESALYELDKDISKASQDTPVSDDLHLDA
ncbi:MAG: ferritin [Chitinophagaceae bacterium]